MYSTGRIDPVWDIKDIENIEYFVEPFNDGETYENWRRHYNLEFGIGAQADFRVAQPACVPDIIKLLEKQNIKLNNVGTSFYKLLPGEFLPYHVDRYQRYCNYHKVDISQIRRIIVFLQDWQPGFLFEVDNTPLVQYPAGTFVMWENDISHMAGNLGFVPRYTLQVTGTI
jgi:hypothetical protein